MQILVACEESQAVTIALRKLGHEAYSCDLIPCSGGHPEWHIQQDVLPLLNGYYHYEERGWITLHGLENVNAMYKEYHALGGNGTVTALVNTIHELEVRDDKRPASQA